MSSFWPTVILVYTLKFHYVPLMGSSFKTTTMIDFGGEPYPDICWVLRRIDIRSDKPNILPMWWS